MFNDEFVIAIEEVIRYNSNKNRIVNGSKEGTENEKPIDNYTVTMMGDTDEMNTKIETQESAQRDRSTIENQEKRG